MQSPSYLEPLQRIRRLQWTKSSVPGENSGKKPVDIKPKNGPRKSVLKNVIRETSRKPAKSLTTTRDVMSPWRHHGTLGRMPVDPMRSGNPLPANAMHMTNEKTSYNSYQP